MKVLYVAQSAMMSSIHRLNEREWTLLKTMSRRAIITVVTTIFFLVGALCIILPGTINSFATGCASGDIQYIVKKGDTLSAIAATYSQTYTSIQQYNHIVNANIIYIDQTVCILSSTSHNTMVSLTSQQTTTVLNMAVQGLGDPFAYGQCTYWASLRYHEYSGVWVPWVTQSNAGQWVARAQQFHWRIGTSPTLGSIVVLQSGVQGAYSLGHVALVERLLKNGQFIASSMNWDFMGANVAYTQFHSGTGVSFLTY